MKSVLIGIGGCSASGKTSLARAVAQQSPYPVRILSLDDFFLQDPSQAPVMVSPSTGEKHLDRNHPRAVDVDRVLSAINAFHLEATQPQILLIEGVFALYFQELLARMDLRVFVDLDADVRIARKAQRNFEQRGQDPLVTLRNHLENARAGQMQYAEPTKHHADVVMWGDKPAEHNAALLLAFILGKINDLPTTLNL